MNIEIAFFIREKSLLGRHRSVTQFAGMWVVLRDFVQLLDVAMQSGVPRSSPMAQHRLLIFSYLALSLVRRLTSDPANRNAPTPYT